jgi:hypothetical protein
MKCIVTRMSVTMNGVWIANRFIEHFYTQLVNTSNCSAIANSHSAIYYSTYLRPLSLLFFTSRCLVMDPNNVLCL